MARPLSANQLDAGPRMRRRSFADQVQIRRGDTAVLGRFMLAAERELDALGLQATLATLDDLRAAVDANPVTWGGVAPAFDARQTTAHPDDLGIILATDRTGAVVAACAQRFYDLGSATLKTAIESNALMYGAHPAGDRTRVVFDVTAPAAAGIRGRVTLLGGLWVHPDQRGTGITVLLCDLTRAFALGTWDFDTEVLVGRDGLVRPHVLAQYGFTAAERGYRHTVEGALVYDGHLIWTRAQTLATRLADQVEREAIGRQRAATG